MENEAYEDESPCSERPCRDFGIRSIQEEAPQAAPRTLHPAGIYSNRSAFIQPLGSSQFLSQNQQHHYEDIPSLLYRDNAMTDNSIRRSFVQKPRSAILKEPSAPYPCSFVEHPMDTLQRNLTLPLYRTYGDQRNSGNTIRSSDRVTTREKIMPMEGRECLSSIADERPSRRRRKKDCKHCKVKAASVLENQLIEENHKKKSEEGHVQRLMHCGEPIFALPDGRLPSFCMTSRCEKSAKPADVFAISQNANTMESGPMASFNSDKSDIEARLAHVEVCEDKALITPPKSRGGMKVNSIYSHDHWHAKDAPIFVTEVKEQSPFQRAYSLPVRTHTPSSQNRVNLRRSVRGEPPPHPARLQKNRHGWTLHLAHPLDGSGCTRSIVLLLIVILALLGIGGIALYIVFEPEKLQIIQQYLRSSARNTSMSGNTTSGSIYLNRLNSSSETMLAMDPTTPIDALLNVNLLFPDTTTLASETETETSPPTTILPDLNATRYCDDCVHGEVCVALVDEDVPICRTGLDPRDPTGCAGLCTINKQKCHRLDFNAFRCTYVGHNCLDDEWTCSNTLCIPLAKRCDGHLNCYDHSDEFNCDCDLQTHFQCGNKTSCLPIEKKCDGKIDCWDATDELNCTPTCPSADQYTCRNGQCILLTLFCDGLQDCQDGSDEPQGCRGKCNKQEYSCKNGRCIEKASKCNGVDDCGDGSDEHQCRD